MAVCRVAADRAPMPAGAKDCTDVINTGNRLLSVADAAPYVAAWHLLKG